MEELQITAAICTYRRGQSLASALASVVNQDLSSDQFEILVVDDSPHGERVNNAADAYANILNLRWLETASVGLSAARNAAISACRTPLIAFLDDDAIAACDWLSRLRSTFHDCREEVFAVGGRVDPLWLAPRPPWLPDELLGHLSLVNWGGERRVLGSREWVAGTNMAFRVAELHRIGGFSTEFGRRGGEEVLLSNDENDVIARLRGIGGTVVYAPDASVQHLVPAERLTQAWFRRRVVWQAVSDYLQHPRELFARSEVHWNTVMRFNASLEPEYQILHSFYIELSDHEIFARQMSALYSYTIVMLTGFRAVNR
jgi:glycosyltransferase involved in cell wall biosynthesis